MTHAGGVYARLLDAHARRAPQLWLLVDPDKAEPAVLPAFAAIAERAGVDGFLVGGSLSLVPRFESCIAALRAGCALPVVIFPGGLHQISGEADALLFLSIVSGRNPDQLIGQHVLAAPVIRALGLEAIPTAYMIVSSDRVTSTEYMSYTKPLPREKPEIAAAHAMAAEMLGMRLVYLEAGSGARETVPDAMVAAVAASVNIPLLVGGGIRTPEEAAAKVRAGADAIIVGNHFEVADRRGDLELFAVAVHSARDTHET
jgi:phosphoglycerol geranylgeranyltransferase